MPSPLPEAPYSELDAVALRWDDDPDNNSTEAAAGLDNITFTPVAIPEPGTFFLGSVGIAAVVGVSRRRR